MSTAFSQEKRTVNGISTAILSAGAGRPLVYLHGAGLTDFSFLLRFADRYRVLVPLHPGFGDSADDPHITEIHDYVLHYLELWDLLELDGAVVIGHSLGGWIAARFACEHARRVHQLILVAPAGLRVDGYETADLFTLDRSQLMSRLVADPASLAGIFGQEPTLDAVVEQYRQQVTLARFAWEWPWDRKLPRWLHRIKVPTLILWGREDGLIPVELGEYWARNIPDAQLHVLDRCGHLVFQEKPEESLAVVDGFLKG